MYLKNNLEYILYERTFNLYLIINREFGNNGLNKVILRVGYYSKN